VFILIGYCGGGPLKIAISFRKGPNSKFRIFRIFIFQPIFIFLRNHLKPEALKSLYRSPGYKKKPIGPM
jgi:hypothetical protein